MALILLQPGIQPLGQFDLDDADVASVVGGEMGILTALDLPPGDGYAADVGEVGPALQVEADSLSSLGTAIAVFGLIDEGDTGYGTLFGTAIGGTAGQGTGLGSAAGAVRGVVVMGPSSAFASGKCTLWTKAGLYGCTNDAFAAGAVFTDAAALNAILDGHNGDGLLEAAGGVQDTGALFVGQVNDSSLVSTTNTAAGIAAATAYNAVYLLGPQCFAS